MKKYDKNSQLSIVEIKADSLANTSGKISPNNLLKFTTRELLSYIHLHTGNYGENLTNDYFPSSGILRSNEEKVRSRANSESPLLQHKPLNDREDKRYLSPPKTLSDSQKQKNLESAGNL